MLSSLPCFPDLLSLHLVTFSMSFSLVESTMIPVMAVSLAVLSVLIRSVSSVSSDRSVFSVSEVSSVIVSSVFLVSAVSSVFPVLSVTTVPPMSSVTAVLQCLH